jgi:hypothetical protein
MKAALTDIVPENQTLIFTVTAPIRLPAKTATELERLARSVLPGGEVRDTIHCNQVRLRRVTGVLACMPRVIGFVHNSECDAGLIIASAESRLLGQDFDL